ncbi:MAG TPA: hypothetical protein VFD82_09990, partial [Planctomycetota bacterium]|nr:hypothetical protein [Planctomycetota bacterium]
MPQFDTLLVGHVPSDPPELALVLGAAGALCGLRADGQAMPGASHPGAPSLRAIAGELGWHVDAVRRGVRHALAVGAMTNDAGQLSVVPEALAARWELHRQRLRLDRTDRERSLRASALLLLGLIRGQLDQHGQLRLGVPL